MIIINCDDFAIQNSTSEAIIICGESHKISSTTIMATKTLYKEQIAKLIAISNLSIGIHLDLDHIFPFDSAQHYGCHQFDREEKLFPLSTSLEKEIIKETQKQIETLLSFNIPISHFDSHHNVHLFPEITPIIIPVFKKFKIDRCRFSTEFFTNEESKNYFINLCKEENILHPHNCFDINKDNLNMSELSESSEIYEIMCHIDLEDEFMNKVHNYNRLMAMETQNLITYKDLPS